MQPAIENPLGSQTLKIEIGAMLSPWQRQIIRRNSRNMSPQELRYKCMVAEATNIALNGGVHGTKVEDYGIYEANGKRFRLNHRCKSQFAMDSKSVPFLTTSLIDIDTEQRWRFTWRGSEQLHLLMEAAVAHDKTENFPVQMATLNFSEAEVHIVGEKNGKPRDDIRPNHDTGKDGQPYPRRPRRHHRRVCEEDL